jgi:hypothetical protein
MCGKLIALDSNILGKVLNTDEISYVKKKCDLNSTKNSGDEMLNQDQSGIQITFHSYCKSMFQLESLVEQEPNYPPNYKRNFRPIFVETKAFTYKFVPPPKFS